MACTKQLYQDVAYLTQTIGERLTGSSNEKKAAEYLHERFLQYTSKCWLESFPIMHRCVEKQTLEVLINNEWVTLPTCLYNLSPTTNGESLEAELVYFDSHVDYQRPDLSYLQGKAVLHYGTQIISEEGYRRLMEAKPAFLLMVDTRYTSDLCIANSLLPAYVQEHGAVPTTDVAFFDTWKICTQGATRAKLTVAGYIKPSQSQNVIAELPGTDPAGDILYCGAHIDGVANSPAADDNAVGCAILLELARILSQKPHRHTIRLIAFGAEEQLSVGSAVYVRAHRSEIEEKGRFMCNFDSCASAVGWFRFVINASTPLRRELTNIYHQNDVYFTEYLVPDPYNDLFPFTVAGVPGITHMRNNCEIGKFYHHRPDNSIEVLSMDAAAQLVNASAAFLTSLADQENLDSCMIDPSTTNTVADFWDMTYGGWNP